MDFKSSGPPEVFKDLSQVIVHARWTLAGDYYRFCLDADGFGLNHAMLTPDGVSFFEGNVAAYRTPRRMFLTPKLTAEFLRELGC